MRTETGPTTMLRSRTTTRLWAWTPKNESAFYNRALSYADSGRLGQAIVDMGNAIRIDPKDPDPYDHRCWFEAQVGSDLSGALSDCNMAIRIKPDDADAFDSRGFVK